MLNCCNWPRRVLCLSCAVLHLPPSCLVLSLPFCSLAPPRTWPRSFSHPTLRHVKPARNFVDSCARMLFRSNVIDPRDKVHKLQFTLPSRGVRQQESCKKSDEKSDRSVRKSDQKVTKNEKSDRTRFVNLVLWHPEQGTKRAKFSVLVADFSSFAVS